MYYGAASCTGTEEPCLSVWKSTSASGAPDNPSPSHFSAMTRPPGSVEQQGTATATPSSRRRVDGVEDESAVKF